MRFRSGGEVIAVAAPLVHRNGVVPDFTLKESTEKSVKLEAPDCTLEMQVNDSRIRFLVNCGTSAADTLNIRLLGNIRNGLLSGIEFLGQGDVSSSPIDLEPPLNERSKPNPQWLTTPLAILATDKGAIMLKWKNAELQPVFSSPNRFGFTDDHLMVLKGKDIDAILIMDDGADGNKSDDSPSVIHYQLKRYFTQHPFPDPPSAPRSAEEQRKLNLQALETLNSPDGTGWGYAVEPDWQREPFADFLSTQHRLTGKVPVPKKIVSGGSDIANDAAYFITNRVEEWLKVRKTAVQSILSLRQPDGSFLQRSRFPNIETKATSYGFTAIRALELMEFVRYTGDKELLSVVEKSLDYLKQCDVPRGGFYRDSPLHTPDLQTAASLVWLCVWAFEFTGKKEYLDEAERFAYLGLPFVYLDGGLKSAANYLTVPKLGGTERRKPLWFGVAKPQTGILYAYALNLLSKHNKSVDWKKIATGILYAAETLQYASGDYAGCLPERYDAVKQERESWKVNPCALVSLRLALEGKLDSLSVLVDGKERYVSPYPLRLTPDGVEVFDIPDTVPTFQILRNGNRIESVNGSGTQLLE
ncbi:MAG: hypothetical protein LBN39_00390, partial [Planctomycetaceae bacterium]|jgi:hypothetical protein|nr:hypothetical protein [Planctomycetaceae bacterium]